MANQGTGVGPSQVDDSSGYKYASTPNTGTGANLPGVNMAPLTGWAKGQGYNPSELNAIWDTPWAILTDVFRGMNPNGPGYQGLRDFGADPLTLYNVMVGGGTDFMSQGGNPQGNYANWLQQLYSNLGTAGGAGFNARDLLGRLFNPGVSQGTTEAGLPTSQSSLYNILTAGDSSTQMRTIYNMLRDIANVGMNPLAARGYASYASRAGDQAVNQAMHTDSGQIPPIYQLLKQIAPGLVPG